MIGNKATNVGVRKLFSDTALFALLPNLSRVISVLMLPLLTPYLTSYDYGVTGVLFAYAAAFEGVRDLGLSFILTNLFFKNQKEYLEIWRRVYGLLSVWGIPFSAIQAVLIYIALPRQEMHNFAWVCLSIVIPTLLADHTINIGRLHFQLNQRPFPIVLAGLAAAIVAATVNYLCIVGLRQGYMGFLYAGAAAKMLTALIYGYVLLFRLKMLPTFGFTTDWIKSSLKISVPMIPHFYAGYLLNTSDRVLMNIVGVPTAQIGLYSFGQSLGGYFTGIGKAILQAFTPAVMALYKNGTVPAEKHARDLLFLAQAGLLLAGFIFALWSKDIVALLAKTPSLKDSYQIAIPIILGQTLYPLYFGAISKLRFAEKTQVFWRISFLAGIISVGANLIAIPLFGMQAAAWVSFFSYLYFGFSAFFSAAYRQVRVVSYGVPVWMTIIVGCLAVTYWCRDSSVQARALLTGLALVGSVVFLLRLAKRLRRRHEGDLSSSSMAVSAADAGA